MCDALVSVVTRCINRGECNYISQRHTANPIGTYQYINIDQGVTPLTRTGPSQPPIPPTPLILHVHIHIHVHVVDTPWTRSIEVSPVPGTHVIVALKMTLTLTLPVWRHVVHHTVPHRSVISISIVIVEHGSLSMPLAVLAVRSPWILHR